jgi:hypothetical protein
MRRFTKNSIVWMLIGLAASAAPIASDAQGPRTTVLVAMVSRLERPGADAAIIQRVRTAPHYVILIPSDRATPSALVAAMRSVRARRAKQSDNPRNRAIVFLYGGVPSSAVGADEFNVANYYLKRLNQSPEHEIPGVGIGRAVRIPIAN